MTISSTALLIVGSTSVLTMSLGALAYEWFFRYRTAVRERLEKLASDDGGERSASLFKDIKRLHAQDRVEHQSWSEWLRYQLEQAGLQCTNRTFVLCCVASGLVTASAGSLRASWLGILCGMAGMMLPFGVARFRKHVRQRKLLRQLPDAFSMIARAVKAGQTVPAALRIIAEDFEPPLSAEFAYCYEQQNLGISRETTLRQLAKRTGIMELQIFVVALLVQAKSGGDLVELLDNLSTMVRKRLKLAARVRALTGEGRMQAIVLTVLPVAALVAITLLSPQYAKTLFERPWLLAGTAVAQAVGVFWIRKIVNFEY